MTEIDVKKLRHKNTDLVRKNGKLRKERDRLKNEIDELREKLDEAKLGLIWHSMLDNVGAMIEENERLKNRTYNLTLYLRESMDATHGTVGFAVRNVLDERHPGLPGYNPEILEVQE